MREYLRILQDIIWLGETKENRTGIDTQVLPPQFFQHDMRAGFPLLTTKKMGLKTIATELEFFIKGLTDKSWLQERGCHIWDDWANPEEVEDSLPDSVKFSSTEEAHQLGLEMQKSCTDLGPIYGYQWRRFNQPYTNIQTEGFEPLWNDTSDQLASAINKLQHDPNNRRIVVSAWNPTQLHLMALPPCHYTFVLQHINGRLSLNWSQRSVDTGLGLPYNIASYALLLELIARHVGMVPHMLTGNLIDTHIYENHVPQLKEQSIRFPRTLPELILPEYVDIFNWERDQFELINYNPHPAIKMDVAV